MEEDKLDMTFIRYLNVTSEKKKIIGFQIRENKEKVFSLML